MKIAITGCNGSVGRRVVNLALTRGHSVVGIDQSDVEQTLESTSFRFVRGDVRDYPTVIEALRGCEAVVQLAAIRNPSDYKVESHNTNVVISWNVLRACAELGINHIAQASSVNVITLVFSAGPKLEYFPIDEMHPTLPDEPYGLSKVICELQADTIVRRYPSMRIASLRLHWSVPSRSTAVKDDSSKAKNDLWSYVQEDSAADAFLLALDKGNVKWSGHEAFFIVAPTTTVDVDTEILRETYWPAVPVKGPGTLPGRRSFFNCAKAEALLGWVHKDGL